MSKCLTDCCSFVRGPIYIGDYRDPCEGLASLGCPPPKIVYRKLGNVLQASLSHQYQVLGKENKYHTNYKQCARNNILGVTLDLQLGCASDLNLKDFLFSDVSNGDQGTNIEEHYICGGVIEKCSIFALEKSNLTAPIVFEVFDSSGGVVDVLTEGINFEYKNRVIEFLEDYSSSDMYKIAISYDYDDTNVTEVKPFSIDNKPKALLLKGTNYANDETKSFDVEIFKFRHNPASNLEVISIGEFTTLRLQGEVEKFYNGSGLECYYKITKGA